ncbi:hypothetical protein EROM_071400 [Encephalitozoon romaleae SJ-2008]|uniref:Uncharacterized protein n=1 Tax=Encephalitozoon romaleae (strain SJ-2008) TaxID=1178016 RepID=I6ZUL4_ENCRO|nr:hypothetical protein EROM_071400 [Encephalitozoon romaleae SJ-2008]AFN83391.1 hypothetical protein EROM_071400 [Encephalitozoon romaleae SJ-2008]
MNLLLFGYAAGQMVAYESERILERLNGLDVTKTVSDGRLDLHLYFREIEDDMLDPPFPLLMQRLKSISAFAIEKGGKAYRIVPFESIEIGFENGKKSYGKFNDIVSMGNEAVVTYTCNGNDAEEGIYSTITIIFTPSDEEEDKIEKIYSGWSDSCLLRVSTPKLKVWYKRRILSMYLEDFGNKELDGKDIGHWVDGINSDGERVDGDRILKEEMMVFEEAGSKEREELSRKSL